MRAVHQRAVDDVIDGVGTPVQRIVRATTRPTAAAPFVGAHDFGAIIIEGGRVPIRKLLIHDGINPNRLVGIGNVEDHPIAGAGSSRELLLWENGNVVAVICAAAALGIFAMVPALPKTRNLA